MAQKKKKPSAYARAQRAYVDDVWKRKDARGKLPRMVRGATIKDKVYGLEAWARQTVADIHAIRERLHKLEAEPTKLPDERFMGMIAHEMVKQNLARSKS